MKKFFASLILSVSLVSCATTASKDAGSDLPECGAVVKNSFGTDGWDFLASKPTGPNSLSFAFTNKEGKIKVVVLALKNSPDATALAKIPSFAEGTSVECRYQDGKEPAIILVGTFNPPAKPAADQE